MTQPWTHAAQTHPVAEPLLVVILAAGGLASALVLGLAVLALARRRSPSYVLVTLALSTLLARVVVGFMDVGGALDATAHHLLEHGLDVLTVALLLGAVYLARRVAPLEGANA